MCLQRYTCNIVYRKGKELYITDTLSRAYVTDVEEIGEDKYDVMESMPPQVFQPQVVTRSGRISKPPEILKAYVRY